MVKRGNKILSLKILLPLILMLVVLAVVFNPKMTGNLINSLSCTDTDNTTFPFITDFTKDDSFFVKGVVQYFVDTDLFTEYTDSCNYKRLAEYACNKGSVGYRNVECPNGCKDGACCKDAACSVSEAPVSSSTSNAEQNCKKEGETIPVIASPPACCSGLTLIKPKVQNILGISGICTGKCGNNVCDAETETDYNCPEDCKIIKCNWLRRIFSRC